MTSEAPAVTKKPWYMKWWVWLIAAVLIIGGISNLVGGGNEPEAATPEPTISASPDAVETPDATPSSEPTTPAPAVSEPAATPAEPAAPSTTPADAEALWLEMHAVTTPLDFLQKEGYENSLANPLYAIQTGWGGSTSDYLEIKVQEQLTDESVKRLGINVLNFIGPSFPDITGIIFTDASGIDRNFFRRDAPLADSGL